MTYPQPNSVAPVLGGQDHFRLLTDLVSSGDIYESEVGALGFVLGPNSDMATVRLTYFDGQAATLTSQAVISPDRDLIGRVDARNETNYPGPGNRRGRILISFDDIYDVRWRPSGFDGNDTISFETPIIDVLQYFCANPSLTPQRSDKVFRYQYFTPPAAANSAWIVVPAFGRKSGFFQFLNRDGINTVTVTVLGVKCSTSGAPGPVGTYQRQLLAPVNILTDGSAIYNYKASTDGIWDMFAVEFANYAGAAMPSTITLSDDVE